MKCMRLIWVVIFAVFIALPVGAQVNIGVLGGINLANVDIDPLEEVELSNLTAFGFGGVLDFNLNEMLTLHLELMYLQKGVNGKWDIYDLENKVTYLEVPILLKYSIGTGNIKPYLIAGPTIGYLLSGTGKISGGGYSSEEDLKETTKNLDYGIGLGAGVGMPMGNNSIFLEARYAMGLANINDDPDDPDTEVKTKGIQIFAGITFPLGD
ncbi:PorT family protein [candidate division KSB1 bacterium]|nr:PorT family protein [candidate division KSB1 bacterium]